MNLTIAFLITNHQFLLHFFIELETKKVGVLSRCRKSGVCRQVRGLLGTSNGDYGRGNFSQNGRGGHILYMWTLSS